ncbi:MAG: SOS response regulatory protein OraA/RecX, partial [Flavobacteriales bacterium]
ELDYPSKQKLMQYAYSRGFEPDLIRRVLEGQV